MRLSHAGSTVSVRFDDPNLVSCAGLAPMVALAQRCGLGGLEIVGAFADRVAANPDAKVTCLVAGMVGGRGLDRRHGPAAPRRDGPAVRRCPGPVDVGHVPARVHASGTFANSTRSRSGAARIWRRTRRCCPARTRALHRCRRHRRATYGHTKQGAGCGTRCQGLNALIATISTPLRRRVIGAARLRKGPRTPPAARPGWSPTRSGPRAGPAHRADRGAGGLRRSTATPVVSACRRAGARLLDHRADDTRRAAAAIGAVAEPRGSRSATRKRSGTRTSSAGSPTPRSPRPASPRSPAAEKRAGHRPADRAPGPPPQPATARRGQGELFPAWRYHPFFTDTAADAPGRAGHRHHAVVEQVIADSKACALAHLPSGQVQRQRRLAHAVGDRLQPAAGRRHPGRRSTPRPPPPPSAPTWSTSPPGSPAPPAASPCTCRATGPGARLDTPPHRRAPPELTRTSLTTPPKRA